MVNHNHNEKIKRATFDAQPGAEIIDMGVGEPDEMAFPEVIDILHTEAQKHGNQVADNGDEGDEAGSLQLPSVCGYWDRPTARSASLHRSKAALSILPAAFINQGTWC